MGRACQVPKGRQRKSPAGAGGDRRAGIAAPSGSSFLRAPAHGWGWVPLSAGQGRVTLGSVTVVGAGLFAGGRAWLVLNRASWPAGRTAEGPAPHCGRASTHLTDTDGHLVGQGGALAGLS